MPISLPPISRRRFLSNTLAAGVGLSMGSRLRAGELEAADPHRFALLADTHISENRDEENSGIQMFQHLQQVATELSRLTRRPKSVLIGGDCAYLTGKSNDYAVLVELLAMIRVAGMPIHLALGNHDHRERFWKATGAEPGQGRPVIDRHLTVLEAARANWFILDSLDETNKTPGVLGEPQLTWLASALDAHADRPALVMAHHHPDPNADTNGIVDTQKMLEVLSPRRQVKAFFFGHTHNWRQYELDGIHFINLPPVAYVFTEGRPSGWVDMQLRSDGATLELHAIDPAHPEHGKAIELAWRA